VFDDGVGLGQLSGDAAVVSLEDPHGRTGSVFLQVSQNAGDLFAVHGTVSIEAESGELFDELLVGFSEVGHGIFEMLKN
jgi:hypothetical protein